MPDDASLTEPRSILHEYDYIKSCCRYWRVSVAYRWVAILSASTIISGASKKGEYIGDQDEVAILNEYDYIRRHGVGYSKCR